MTKPESFTFTLDDSDPRASTMRLDVAPTAADAKVFRSPYTLTIHTSAAQATVRHSGMGRVTQDDLALLIALARCAFAEGRSAAGGDTSEVVLTAPDYTAMGAQLGAVAWMHYTDDKGRLQCGVQAPRIRGFHGAANIIAATIEGAAVCPLCAAMHRAEASLAREGATHVE